MNNEIINTGMDTVIDETSKSGKKYDYVTKTFVYDGLQYKVRGKSEKEAIKKQIELETALKKGLPVKQNAKKRGDTNRITGNISVRQYSDHWLKVYIRPRVRPAGLPKDEDGDTMTEKEYKMYPQKLEYILDAVGDMKLKTVHRIDLQEILNAEAARGMSKSHCEKLKIVIHKMFHDAYESRIISDDPSQNLYLPYAKSSKRRAITEYERQKILEVAEWHRCGPWVRFLLNTGLRVSESAALKVSNIDFQKKIISVCESVESGTKVLAPPKSAAGTREVPIRSDYLPELRKLVKGKQPSDYVFTQMDGRSMMTSTVMTNNWRSFSRQVDLAMGAETTNHGHIYDPNDIDGNGVPKYPDKNGNPRNGHKIAPDLVPHCLRHTFCTELQKAGVPINIAKVIMGHSSIEMTARIYTHTDNADIQAVGKQLDQYYQEKKRQKNENHASDKLGHGNQKQRNKKSSHKEQKGAKHV